MTQITLRDLQIGDAGWLIGQHGILYNRDEGFDASFEAAVAEILVDFIRSRDPSCERAWIAEQDGIRLGSIFCVKKDSEIAKLRLFLLMPQARGQGLGHRLLSTCMDWARDRGYRRMELWTHESHKAACALYASHGWRLDSAVSKRNYGVNVVEQIWKIEL